MYCYNCFQDSHSFKFCKFPILSYGILCYRENTGKFEYLTVQRKDTIAYIDMVKGRYHRTQDLEMYFAELCQPEIYKLLYWDYHALWDSVFFNKATKSYTNEYQRSKALFEDNKIRERLLDYWLQGTRVYPEQDYGIPKGRKTPTENILECAKREFSEETGYTEADYTLLDLVPFKETYRSIDNRFFTNIYFLAKMNPGARDPTIDPESVHQAGEIQKVRWGTFDETYRLFRKYHHIKRGILYTFNRYLEKKI